MGRTRTKNRKQKQLINKPPASAEASTSQPTLQSLIEKAQSLITQCDYDLANLFIQRILQRSPEHVEAKEMLGVVQLEMGLIDEARETFESLIPPHPNAPSPPPHSAYLHLAQLSDEDPQVALRYYKCALDLLLARNKGKERAGGGGGEEDEGDEDVKKTIVRVLISMAEIWMDPSYDLCFDPAAEKTCEELINLALQTDPGNVEALQTLASVRLSQQRPDEAKQCLEKAWIGWKDLDLDDPKVPPIPTRLSLVKLFLELSLFTPALLTLQGIMSSDDQEVEAWYLEGWAFYLMAEQAQQNGGKLVTEDSQEGISWEELARDSRDCLETCRTLHVSQDHGDMPILEHVTELVTSLDAKGIMPSPEDDEENGDGWEDLDDNGSGEDDDGDVQMV